MLIADNDEEKRSKIWRTVLTVSTIVILAVGAYFLYGMFTSNPLEGTWQSEDSTLKLTIKKESQVQVEWPEKFEGSKVSVVFPMNYQMEKEMKLFTIQMNESEIKKVEEASKGAVSADELTSAAESLEATYNYSVDQNILTLTDSEYGDQMIFEKQ
ncbi:MAG: hypothetical protein PHN80_14185 [Hespellia sp.]|nr:hypothetical protein [Hespellia sp.]